MEILDIITYVLAPVVAWILKELYSLKDKLATKADKSEVDSAISKYLDPRLAPIQDALSRTQATVERSNDRLNEIIVMLATWQNNQAQRTTKSRSSD